MRSKMDYVIEEDEKTHKKKPRKLGLAPIMRDGTEYEFTIVWDLQEGTTYKASVSKDRTSLFAGKFEEINAQTGKKLLDWLKTGAATTVPKTSASAAPAVVPAAPVAVIAKEAPEQSAVHARVAAASDKAREEDKALASEPERNSVHGNTLITDETMLKPGDEWTLEDKILKISVTDDTWHALTNVGVKAQRRIWTKEARLGNLLSAANGHRVRMILRRGSKVDLHQLYDLTDLTAIEAEPQDIPF